MPSLGQYYTAPAAPGLVQEMASWLPDQPSLHRLRFMVRTSPSLSLLMIDLCDLQAHVGLVVRGLGRVQEVGPFIFFVLLHFIL